MQGWEWRVWGTTILVLVLIIMSYWAWHTARAMSQPIEPTTIASDGSAYGYGGGTYFTTNCPTEDSFGCYNAFVG